MNKIYCSCLLTFLIIFSGCNIKNSNTQEQTITQNQKTEEEFLGAGYYKRTD